MAKCRDNRRRKAHAAKHLFRWRVRALERWFAKRIWAAMTRPLAPTTPEVVKGEVDRILRDAVADGYMTDVDSVLEHISVRLDI